MSEQNSAKPQDATAMYPQGTLQGNSILPSPLPSGDEQTDVQAWYRNYLGNGGLFNPEMMEHQKVADLLAAFSAELDQTRAERDALKAELASLKVERTKTFAGIAAMDREWKAELERADAAEATHTALLADLRGLIEQWRERRDKIRRQRTEDATAFAAGLAECADQLSARLIQEQPS